MTYFYAGDTVQGCHYTPASVADGEIWLVTNHGARIAHAVSNKEFVCIQLRTGEILCLKTDKPPPFYSIFELVVLVQFQPATYNIELCCWAIFLPNSYRLTTLLIFFKQGKHGNSSISIPPGAMRFAVMGSCNKLSEEGYTNFVTKVEPNAPQVGKYF